MRRAKTAILTAAVLFSLCGVGHAQEPIVGPADASVLNIEGKCHFHITVSPRLGSWTKGGTVTVTANKDETDGLLTRQYWADVTVNGAVLMDYDLTISSTGDGVRSMSVVLAADSVLTISWTVHAKLLGSTWIPSGADAQGTVTLTADGTGPSIAISPTGRWYTAATTLTWYATDLQSGVDAGTKQYRVGAGSWTAGDSVRVSGEGDYALQFRASDLIGNLATRSDSVGIDTTAPVVTANDVAWTNGSPSATASATDNLSGRNDSTWTWSYVRSGSTISGTGSTTSAITYEGQHVVTFRVSDNAGNQGSDTATVRIDKTAPAITASDVAWTNASPSVTASAADGLSGVRADSWTWSYVSGGSTISGTGRTAGPITAEGAHTLTFRVSDTAGNAATRSVSVRVDTTAPSITLSAPLRQGTPPYYAGADFAAAATDVLSGVSASSWRWWTTRAGVAGESGTGTIAAVTADGLVTISFECTDTAGNVATAIGEVYIDRTGPALSVEPGWRTSREVTVAAADGGVGTVDASSLAWSLDGVLWNPGDTAMLASDGEAQSVWFRAADTLGNLTEAELSVSVDTTPPELGLSVPTAGADFGVWSGLDAVLVSATAVDASSGVASVEYSLDGGAWAAWPGDPLSISSEGITQVAFRATDVAGNQSVQSESVLMDRTAPVLSIAIGPAGTAANQWTAAATVTVSVDALDAPSGLEPGVVQYRLGAGEWLQGSTAVVGIEGKTAVSFRAADAAGNSGNASVEVWIDRTGPVVSAAAERFVLAADGSIGIVELDATDAASGVSADSQTWSVDGGAPAALTVGAGGRITLPLLGEGSHTLTLAVEDRLGNSGVSSVGIVADRTPPVVTALETADSDGVFGDAEVRAATTIRITPTAVDYVGDGTSGEVVTFEYVTAQAPVADFAAAVRFDGPWAEATGLPEGLTYLWVRAVDGAGNPGAAAERVFTLNTAGPVAPEIVSISHPRALSDQDAVPVSSAVFILSPQSSSSVPVASYDYVLSKGVEDVATGTVAARAETRIELEGLGDNAEAEFYRLGVWSVGANGLRSSVPATYRFRVDTTPPTLLRVFSATHANPDHWYASSAADLSWNRPLDMTGVSTYYLWASTVEPEIPLDPSTWVRLDRESTRLDLAAVTGAAYGTVHVVVCAEDYAGNRQFDATVVRFDIEAPRLEQTPPFLLETDVAMRTLAVSWQAPLDANPSAGSGRVELSIASILADGATGAFCAPAVLDPAEGATVFGGLDPDGAYYVLMRVVDGAGNARGYDRVVAMDGSSVPAVSVPFEVARDGYRLTGVRESGGTVRDARLEVPVGLELREWSATESTWIPAAFMSIAEVQFEASDPVQATVDPTVSYRMSVAGFVADYQGIVYGPASGLVAATMTYEAEVLVSGEPSSQITTYANVAIVPPPRSAFSSCGSTSGPVSVALRDAAAGETWRILDAASSSFSDTRWLLTDGLLDTAALRDQTGALVYRQEAEERLWSVPAPEVRLSPSAVADDAPLTGGFTIESGGALLDVRSALVRADRIVVLDADLVVTLSGVATPVAVSGLSLGRDGLLRQEPGFSSGTVAWTDSDGTTFTVSEMAIMSGSFVVTAGTLVTPDGRTLAFEGTRMTAEGPAYDLGARIASFEAVVHGFHVISSSAWLDGARVLLDQATLTSFPLALGGGEHVLRDLELRLADSAVLVPGSSDEDFAFSAVYGGDTSITSLVLDAEGLFADGSVSLPAVVGGGTLGFTRLALVANGTMGESASDPTQREWEIAGHAVRSSDTSYDGAVVRVGHAAVTVRPADADVEIDFSDLRLSAIGITQPGMAGAEVQFQTGDFSVRVDELELSEDGVSGVGHVVLDPAFVSKTLDFPDLRFLPAAGGFASGYAAEDSHLRISGWRGVARDCLLLDGTLSLGRFDVQVLAGMGETCFEIASVVVAADATVLSCGTDAAARELQSWQGFATVLTGATLVAEGIRGDAAVTLPDSLGDDVTLSYGDALLGPDGRLITGESGSFTYRIGEWSIGGNRARVVSYGLVVGESSVLVPGTTLSIALGELEFRPHGELYDPAEVEDSIDLPLFAGSVRVERLTFDEEGFSMQAWVVLPPAFGGDSIFFDGLVLHADGSLSTTVPVSEASFVVGGSGGVTFVFREVFFDRSGLSIGSAKMRLPEALESRSVSVENLRIDSSGTFSFSGLTTDPFELWGYTFYIDGIGFADGVISFAGSVVFPESLPGQLSGREVSISDFRFDIPAREVLAFSVVFEGELAIPFGDRCELVITDLGVEKNQQGPGFLIAAEEARLVLPSTIPVGAVAVTGVRFNPFDGSFVFDDVTIEDLTFERFGLDFVLTEIVITPELDMTFRGMGTLPDSLPAPLAGATVVVGVFELLHTGEIGDVQASVSGMGGTLFDTLVLSNAEVGVDKDDSHFWLLVSGEVRFGPSFPDYLVGQGVALERFVLDPEAGTVLAFEAATLPMDLPLGGGTRVEDAVIGIKRASATAVTEVYISGGIRLSSSAPAALNGGLVEISAFRLGLDGTLLELEASLSLPGERPLFGGVLLRDGELGARYEDGAIVFSVAGTILLGPTFPAGVAGLSCTISRLSIDTSGGLRALSAIISIPQQQLFDTLELRGGSISLLKEGSDDLVVSVAGQLVLPAAFPEGLARLVVNIYEFTIDSSGTIRAVRAGAANINVSIFDALAVEDGSISVTGASQTGLTFSVAGDIVLPATLPAPLAGTRFRIESLVVSTQTGLVDFRAGLASAFTFKIFADISVSFTSFLVDKEGFSLTGSVTFPQSFPNGLAGMSCALSSFEMTWGGKITAISGGVQFATIGLGGFTTTIRNLMFHPDHVSLESCVLSLPASIGGQGLQLKNARFDSSGAFSGEVALSFLKLDIAGFSLVLRTLGLDVPGKRITFASAELVGPAMLGGFTLKLNGVGLGPSGLTFSGGAFRLPDFTVAGGLGFRNVAVDFSFSSGLYLISGSGQAIIPGAGTFGAAVAFTNVSTEYPIGLKRAYFSYEVFGLGLPLGTTGLYLNKIAGGIAFGPPEEVPDKVRPLFRSGTRIALGLGVQDQTMGKAFKGTADVWVDVTNWAFAFEGNMTFLSGLVKADVIAAYSQRVFYGYVYVELKVVRGQVEFYVYNYNGPKVSGSGSIQFGVEKGAIWNGKLVKIPNKEWWSPAVGAEFGLFKNGKQGFKAFVDVPLFGQVGLFVGDGKPKIGGVAEYVLYQPLTASLAPRVAAGGAPATRYSTQSFSVASPGTDHYRFSVPGQTRASATPIAPTSARTPWGEGPQADVSGGSGDGSAEVERLVFAIGYTEGDPVIAAISPSGRRYSSTDPGIELTRTEWGMLLVVMAPEAGEWSLDVSNVPSTDSYEVVVLGKETPPEISVLTPRYEGETVDGSYTVEGTVRAPAGAVLTAYVSREPDGFVGLPVASQAVDASGSFSLRIAGRDIGQEESYVFVGVQTGDEPEQRAYAPGSLRQSAQATLAAPEGLLVSEAGVGEIDVRFTDPNGSLAQGFVVYVSRSAHGTEERIEVGYLTDVSIPGFDSGESVAVSVAAVDRANGEGPRSASVAVELGAAAPEVNVISAASAPAELAVVVEETASGAAEVNVSALSATGDAMSLITAAVTAQPEGLLVSFPLSLVEIQGAVVSVPFQVAASDGTAPGAYVAEIELANLGNRRNAVRYSVPVAVSYPPVVVESVSPASWNNRDEAELEILGSGFSVGSRVYLDELELAVGSRTSRCLTATAPAGVAAGTHALRVSGGNGDIAETAVEVVAPSYSVIGLLGAATASAGQTASLYLTVDGRNGWEGRAGLIAIASPPGWSVGVSPSTVAAGEEATVEVAVPADAATGSYEITIRADNGVEAPLTVTVVAAAPEPVVDYVSRTVVLPGDEIVIYGSGLGASGTVRLGTESLAVGSWSAGRIAAAISEDCVSGDLVVERDGLLSNAVAMVVLETGISLYGPPAALDLQPGETRSVDIAVCGYARSVTVSLDSPLMDAALDQSSVVPNAVVSLALTAPEQNGRYVALVRAQTGSLTSELGIEVVVGEAFAISTEDLPGALEDVPYSSRIESANGSGDVSYEVVDGRLPLGIALHRSGALRGTPQTPEVRSFRVRATDAEGHTTTRSLEIAVSPNAWTQDRMDGGATGYNAVPSPADDRVRWSSAVGGGGGRLLVASERVLVLGPDSLVALDRDTGRVTYRVEGTFSDFLCLEGRVYLLGSDGILRAHEARYGGELWSREGVRRIAADGATLLLAREDGIDLLDPDSGTLRESMPLVLESQAQILWRDGRLYVASGSALSEIVAGERLERHRDAAADIDRAACDAEGFVLALSDGRLVALDAEHDVVAESDAGRRCEEMSLAGGRVVLVAAEGYASYARADLSPLHEIAVVGSALASAARKDFVAGDLELVALNAAAGTVVWRRSGAWTDVALAGSKLYAIGGDGRAVCFDAPDNLAAPETTAVVEPGVPDGENGYYRTQPVVSLVSRDAETLAAATYCRVGEEPPVVYGEPLAMADGTTHLTYWSVDTDGLREQDRIAVYQVDTVAPEVSATLAGDVGTRGVYWSSVTVELGASDVTSGVDRIEYSLDAGAWSLYTAAVVYGVEGSHELAYRATDRAGNVSEERSVSFVVDLWPPEVAGHASVTPGLGIVYLEAADSSSELESIEYRLDGGELSIYSSPILIPDEGEHVVSYRATDVSGRVTEWEELSLVVAPYSMGELVRDLRFWRPAPWRSVVEDAQVGEVLFGGVRHAENRIDALPEGLAGSWFIRLSVYDRRCDESVLASFRAGDDLEVTLFVHAQAQPDLTGWTLVAEAFPVEGEQFFVGGADVYVRAYQKGERVDLPGPRLELGAWPELIFVSKPARKEVRIVLPEPGVLLRPEQTLPLMATNLTADSGLSTTWRVRYGDGEWTPVGASGLQLPYVETETRMQLEATVSDAAGVELGSRVERYRIENGARARLVSPAPGSVLVAGSTVPLVVQATDVAGDAVVADVVVMRERVGEGEWTPASVVEGMLTVPAAAGAYGLEARWPEDGGRERSREWRLRIAEAPEVLTVRFGSGDGEVSRGEVEGERASGRIYGFSVDHRDRVRMYWTLEPGAGGHWWPGGGTYVALRAGESFGMEVGTGRRKVRLVLGVFERRTDTEVDIGGKSFTMAPDERKRLCAITTEIESADGRLEISGSSGLALVEIRVEELDAAAAAVADEVEDLPALVLAGQGDPWGDDWWDWEGCDPRDWDEWWGD